MFAHAPKGELNYSNNPTYLEYSHAPVIPLSSGSNFYKEPDTMLPRNTISSSYCDYSASLERQTFIIKVGIYDKNRNLIAVAKTANPVRKKELDDYTFKLKLDM